MAIIERFNRTLKGKMFKYFTAKGTRKFIDILPELLKSYNGRVHRTIKLPPVKVTKENQAHVFENIYGAKSVRELLKKNITRKGKKNSNQTGDSVRISYPGKPFDKGYYPNWSDRVYEIKKKIPKTNKNVYKLNDELGNVSVRNYYPEEIQAISDQPYRIEKILKRRGRNNKIEYFVKWLNYPSEFNSWISANATIKLTE